ncbi:MAG: hypothetical protein OH316_02105 [Candidatus Parvarchaeota archaeon]|nr:hypothetical protein [Candidatus Parvarchaeota archaeon]
MVTLTSPGDTASETGAEGDPKAGSKRDDRLKDKKPTTLLDLFKAEAVEVNDRYLFLSRSNAAYLINKDDFTRMVNDFELTFSGLQEFLENLGAPVYAFDFKERSLWLYTNEIKVLYKNYPDTSSSASIIYHFAKARLDKQYLDEVKYLYL